MAEIVSASDEGRLAKIQQGLPEQLLRVGVNGFGPFKNAEESAREASRNRSKERAVAALVRSHVAAAAAQGFVTNIGGLDAASTRAVGTFARKFLSDAVAA